MPERLQLSRRRGYRKPAGCVLVARPSKWGNPFGIDCWEWRMCGEPHWACVVRDTHRVVSRHDTRADAVAKAVAMFRRLMTLDGRPLARFVRKWYLDPPPAPADLAGLRGKDLACWCPAGRPCHADVLIEIANRGTPC